MGPMKRDTTLNNKVNIFYQGPVVLKTRGKILGNVLPFAISAAPFGGIDGAQLVGGGGVAGGGLVGSHGWRRRAIVVVEGPRGLFQGPYYCSAVGHRQCKCLGPWFVTD